MSLKYSPDLARILVRWYVHARRDLPWRVPPGSPRHVRPDPYHVLVSECMLQQTQVATVIPYFHRFLAEFPTICALAEAPEQRVLRLWQGLGYYSRARNLHAAARLIVATFAGNVPRDPSILRTLPGIGDYTAAAIASLAYDEPAAVLDGNVARVLCRLDRVESDPRDPTVRKALWARAQQLLHRRAAGDFNSAMMELGATICTPRNPRCDDCPVRTFCKAFAAGVQDRIPMKREKRKIPLLRRQTLCIRRRIGKRELWLVEKRPDTGRWADMWQFVTRPANGRASSLPTVGKLSHTLTHRKYEFDVRLVEAKSIASVAKWRDPTMMSRWMTLRELDEYPLPRVHQRIAGMLRGLSARV